MKQKKVIALLGCTRAGKTTTESIVDYMIKNIENNDIQIDKYRADQIYNVDSKLAGFIEVLSECDMLLVCSPVYVHSLPYPLLCIMEQLAKELDKNFWDNKKMIAIIHNGYPQPIQRKTCFEICENFADQMGIKWLGGIGFGGSPIIDGRPLEKVGSYTKWMRRSLDELCSSSIVQGKEVTAKAEKLADKHFPSFIPLWILKVLMNMRMKQQAKEAGVDIYDKPYLNS